MWSAKIGMDKHTFTEFKDHHPSGSLSCLNDASALTDLAKEKRFMRRKRGSITPMVFLTAMMQAVQTESISFRLLAVMCGSQSNRTVAKQSLWERVTPSAFKYISSVLCQIMTSSYQVHEFTTRCIQRVLVADSTIIKLHPSLEKSFPGSKNQYAKTSQSSARLQVLVDLFSGEFLHFNLSSFRRNDQSAAMDIVSLLRKGDLLLRDLGYFTLASLNAIHLKGAYFVSRCRYGTNLYDDEDEKINLHKKIRKARKAGLSKVRLLATIGKKHKTPILVEAVLLPKKVAAERRRKAKKDRDKRINHSAAYYELLDWNIMITNLSEEELEELDLYKMYSLRWRIENIFKAWKSNLGPKNLANHKTNDSHVRCLLVAHMIVLVKLSHLRVFQIPGKADLEEGGRSEDTSSSKNMSMFKMLDILILLDKLYGGSTEAIKKEIIGRQLKYHGLYEKRRTRENLPACAHQFLA